MAILTFLKIKNVTRRKNNNASLKTFKDTRPNSKQG